MRVLGMTGAVVIAYTFANIVRTRTIWVITSALRAWMRPCRRWRVPWTVLAGGTDFYPARVGRAIDENVLDITGIAALRGISAGPGGWRLGATTTWSELIETAAAAPVRRAEAGRPRGRRPADPERRHARRQPVQRLAGRRRRAAACWRSMPRSSWPAAPERGVCRSSAFITGNRRTVLAPGELLVAIHVPQARARPAAPSSSSARAAIS